MRLVRTTDRAPPTPCAGWDVHDLVDHLATEQPWVPLLLEGRTPEEVGDRFDGEVPGEEPLATSEVAAREARAAWPAPSARGRTVHLSCGDTPAEDHLREMTFDLGASPRPPGAGPGRRPRSRTPWWPRHHRRSPCVRGALGEPGRVRHPPAPGRVRAQWPLREL